MATALIGIGSNLGDRRENIRRGLGLLAEMPAIKVVNRSRLYSSKPVGGPHAQGDYVNAAAVLSTSLAPHALLTGLHNIEAQLGRTRESRWAPRTLDLDLLLFENLVFDDDVLTLPHPRMSFRRFVLRPAAEIAAKMVHPVTAWRIGDLLARLDRGPHYVAIGGSLEDQSWLARRLGSVLDCPLVMWGRLHDSFRDDSPAFHLLSANVESYKCLADLLTKERWNALPILQPLLDWSSTTAEVGWLTPPVVSDFWFEEWRLRACMLRPLESKIPIGREEYAQLLEELASLSRTVVAPKLVIWLDGRSTYSARLEQRRTSCVSEMFRESPCGPLLRLDCSDREWMLTESMMAIKAMKPLEGVVS